VTSRCDGMVAPGLRWSHVATKESGLAPDVTGTSGAALARPLKARWPVCAAHKTILRGRRE